jgi:hypothetical protein
MAEKIYCLAFAFVLLAVVSMGLISMARQEFEEDKACRDRGGVMIKPWNSQPACVSAPNEGSN